MKVGPQSLTRGQRILVGLFGAACFVAGVSLLVGATDTFYGYWRTRREVTVEARLRSVELRVSGGRNITTASTDVRYDYHFGGQSFTGSRVAIFKSSAAFYPRLSAALHSNTPIILYVDPKRPHFAVIDRTFSWWPVIISVPFSLVFTAVGIFLLRCLFWTKRT